MSDANELRREAARRGGDQRRAMDRVQIERMSRLRWPQGALSRELLILLERVEALEVEVKRLRGEP